MAPKENGQHVRHNWLPLVIKKQVVDTRVQSQVVTVCLNGQSKSGGIQPKAMKRNQEKKEDVTYLKKLGKVLVNPKKLLLIDVNEQRVKLAKEKQSIVNE